MLLKHSSLKLKIRHPLIFQVLPESASQQTVSIWCFRPDTNSNNNTHTNESGFEDSLYGLTLRIIWYRK